jgi:hypothetical protein
VERKSRAVEPVLGNAASEVLAEGAAQTQEATRMVGAEAEQAEEEDLMEADRLRAEGMEAEAKMALPVVEREVGCDRHAVSCPTSPDLLVFVPLSSRVPMQMTPLDSPSSLTYGELPHPFSQLLWSMACPS